MKILKPLIASALILAGMAGTGAADQMDEVKANGTLTCGVLAGFEPYGFQDPETREPIGYEIDMCRAFAASLGVEPVLKVVTTQGRIPELLQSRVDTVIALISYTEARDEQVDYSGIYMRGTTRFMVQADSKFAETQDLSTARIAVAKGSSLETYLRENYPEATVVGFDDRTASYLALKAGRVDALLTQTDTLSAFKNRDPDGDKLVILPEVVYATRMGFIFRPGESAMLDAANEFLNAAEADGTVQSIWDKWFGPDTEYKMERDFTAGEPAKI